VFYWNRYDYPWYASKTQEGNGEDYGYEMSDLFAVNHKTKRFAD